MNGPAIGALVMYCGHDGWFVADIFRVGDACVVKAGGPVTPANIVRGCSDEATHHLVDFPSAGCWCPDRGVFVVPAAQVRELR